AAAAGGAAATEDWVRVRRDDLLLGVEVTGVLRAVNTDFLGPPAIPDLWDFKISFMAPEGEPLRKGQPALGFDVSQLARKLEEKQTESESVRNQIEKKLSDAAMTRRDQALKLAEAE